MMVNDFLFELGCEELPSASVYLLSNALADNVCKALQKSGIAHGSCQIYATPRRLAVWIKEIALEQPDQYNVRRGPALAAAFDAQGNPTPALKGFARSAGVEIQDLKEERTDKGAWLIAETFVQGMKTKTLLPKLIEEAVASLPVAKPMRWGNGVVEFARPVHWILMLFGKELIEASILGLQSGAVTYGHRFHAPQALVVPEPSMYETLLEQAFVMPDYDKRRAYIKEQVEARAAACDARAVMPDNLLNEVTSIVEWPQVLTAGFKEEFLKVPSEALIASMQAHQKCFALEDSNGKLLARFVTVSNIISQQPQRVVQGNEKVMCARLSDAAFFFEQDKKYPLSHYLPKTAHVVFQAKLGSLMDKAFRIQSIMGHLTEKMALDKSHALRAAELCKCDLLTGMVGEFPELQGLMGYYYAMHDGEPECVAQALYEQYLPRFSGDVLPLSKTGLVLSLVDRMDTLVGIFAIGQKPSGDKDPFKLRRHALAVVRILIQEPDCPGLAELIKISLSTLPAALQNPAVLNDLKFFILERLLSWYQNTGVSQDFVMAVRACQDDHLHDLDKRIRALSSFIKLPEAAMLAGACKRVNNLLQGKNLKNLNVQTEHLCEQAEQYLWQSILTVEEHISTSSDYTGILNTLASLAEPVDSFFSAVMVMVENQVLQANRLALLSRLQKLLQTVADIGCLQFS